MILYVTKRHAVLLLDFGHKTLVKWVARSFSAVDKKGTHEGGERALAPPQNTHSSAILFVRWTHLAPRPEASQGVVCSLPQSPFAHEHTNTCLRATPFPFFPSSVGVRRSALPKESPRCVRAPCAGLMSVCEFVVGARCSQCLPARAVQIPNPTSSSCLVNGMVQDQHHH